jgi:nitrilase
MIIDPWGRVLASRDVGDGVVIADIDLELLADIRRRFPSLTHRRLGRSDIE